LGSAASAIPASADPGIVSLAPVAANGSCSGVDDSSRVQTAMNTLPANAGVVYFQGGLFCFASAISLPNNRPLHVRGAGMNATELRWTQVTNGLVGSYGLNFYTATPVTISEMTLSSGAASPAGTAISITFSAAASVNEPTARMFNLLIRQHPINSPGRSWSTGISLDGAWQAHVNDVFIHGDPNKILPSDVQPLSRGIVLKNASQDVVLTRIKISNADQGIRVEADGAGEGEGTQIDKVSMFRVHYGVVSESAAGVITPWMSITNTFVEAWDVGFYLVRRDGAVVTGNEIARAQNATISTFIGIYVASSSLARVSSNHVAMHDPSSGTHYGIVIDASTAGTLTGNSFSQATIAAWLTPSATLWTVTGNTREGGLYTVINQGTNNTVGLNTP
jgi:hypothetical protein